MTEAAGSAARRIALASLLARRDGFLEARVEGRSMGETLPEGSLIRVQPGRDRDFVPGDVVAIAVNEKIVVHRVLRASTLLLTRGDAEVLPDPPVPGAWVIGPVIEARVEGGSWGPVGPAPRTSALHSMPASAAANLVAGLLAVSPTLADRAARAMLFCAHLARFVLSGGREGRLVWPGRP